MDSLDRLMLIDKAAVAAKEEEAVQAATVAKKAEEEQIQAAAAAAKEKIEAAAVKKAEEEQIQAADAAAKAEKDVSLENAEAKEAEGGQSNQPLPCGIVGGQKNVQAENEAENGEVKLTEAAAEEERLLTLMLTRT